MSKIAILGLGISGIIAKNYFGRDSTGYERTPLIRKNNLAVMRTDDERIGQMLGIALQKIKVRKAVCWGGKLVQGKPSITAANLYSLKVNGMIGDRSILTVDSNDVVDRYLFDQSEIRMPTENCLFNHTLVSVSLPDRFLNFDMAPEIKEGTISDTGVDIKKFFSVSYGYDTCISTLPMPMLLRILKISKFDHLFNSEKIYVSRITVLPKCGAYQTIYFPESRTPVYRATLEGSLLIIESIGYAPDKEDVEFVLHMFGMNRKHIESVFSTVEQKMGKISSLDDTVRKSILLYITNHYNIYSLGRYALWKPSVKIRQTIDDVIKIKQLISIDAERRQYESKLDFVNR